MTTHIMFDSSSGSSLKQAFNEQKIADRVVVILDDLMTGPLGNIMLPYVQTLRIDWWKQILSKEDKTDFIPLLQDNYEFLCQWVNSFTENDNIIFWVGDSPTEHTGLMFLLSQLPESIPMSVIMVSVAYKKRYGSFRPRSTGEVIPDKLVPLIQDANPISQRVKDGYINNWNRLTEDKGNLRVRKNRLVETVTEEYYDLEIIERAKKIEKSVSKNKGYFPALRLVGDIIGHQKQRISDEFIQWRIRFLIQKGIFNYRELQTDKYEVVPGNTKWRYQIKVN
jgi:hypothetical protein